MQFFSKQLNNKTNEHLTPTGDINLPKFHDFQKQSNL